MRVPIYSRLYLFIYFVWSLCTLPSQNWKFDLIERHGVVCIDVCGTNTYVTLARGFYCVLIKTYSREPNERNAKQYVSKTWSSLRREYWFCMHYAEFANDTKGASSLKIDDMLDIAVGRLKLSSGNRKTSWSEQKRISFSDKRDCRTNKRIVVSKITFD